ncbi:MAG: response regulator transcription factor [Pseudomonadota bacterium]
MSKKIKIIIAEDHPLFRDALRGAVKQPFNDPIVEEAESFSTLQRTVHVHGDADLILLDLLMPGSVGFSALNYLGLECPQIPVVVISGNDDESIAARALKFGAMAFAPKSAPLDDIVAAISCALNGNTWAPEGTNTDSTVAEDDEQANFATQIAALTPKQFRVFMMLAEGHQNKHIAKELFITEATVKAHLTTVFQKLGVQNRTQAAALASRNLLVEREAI